jgi:L-fuconolactonase
LAGTAVIDTHVHVACGDTDRYPRSPRGVGSDWWRSGHDASALVAALDAAGVARAVVVQAVGPYGYDNRCAIDAVAARPDRLSLVVAVDPDSPDPAADLAHLAENAPLAGVRLFGVGGGEPAWLTDGRGGAVWDAAGALGITVVPVVFPRHLAAVRALAQPRPAVVVALDHAGFPDHPLDAAAPVLGLADLPAVHLKVSSHLLLEAADPAVELDRLVAAFGADRLCWGSDYPQTSPDYGVLLACGRDAAAGLSAADRDAFLAGTAARLF